MKITETYFAATDGVTRFYAKINGVDWLVPVSKSFVLLSGIAELPEGYPGGQTLAALTDPTDEESDLYEVGNATQDPVYVLLCIHALAAFQHWEFVPLPVPKDAATAAREIKQWREKQGTLEKV